MDSWPKPSISIDVLHAIVIQFNRTPLTNSSVTAGPWMQLLTQKERGKQIRRGSGLKSLCTSAGNSCVRQRPMSNTLQPSYFIPKYCTILSRDPKVPSQHLITSQNYDICRSYLGLTYKSGISAADLDTKTAARIQLPCLTRITISLLMWKWKKSQKHTITKNIILRV